MTSRSLNPAPIYPQAPGGFMYYYKAGTSTPINTYADLESQILNDWPVPLSATGLLPNVFVEGSRKQRLVDKDLAQIWERDDVGVESTLGQYENWDAQVIYEFNDIAEGSNGLFYRSIVSNNQGEDPITPSPTKWTEFVLLGVYNASDTYGVGDVIQEASGLLWSSTSAGNIGNIPSTDDGTNWQPPVDSTLVINNIYTVIPQTGGGELTAKRTNELQDGGTYTVPLASSIGANESIIIDLPSTYGAFEPVVNRTGADTFTNIDGSDTSIEFAGPTTITLVSDGVSVWRL